MLSQPRLRPPYTFHIEILICAHGLGDVGHDSAGADLVEADALIGVLESCSAHETGCAALGSRIGAAAGDLLRHGVRGGDDGGFMVEEVTDTGPEHVHNAGHIYGDDLLPDLVLNDTLTGGALHIFPEAELNAQRAELEAEAAAMAARQGCTVEMIRGFFGPDLAMLERDVKTKKAEDWIAAQQ